MRHFGEVVTEPLDGRREGRFEGRSGSRFGSNELPYGGPGLSVWQGVGGEIPHRARNANPAVMLGHGAADQAVHVPRRAPGPSVGRRAGHSQGSTPSPGSPAARRSARADPLAAPALDGPAEGGWTGVARNAQPRRATGVRDRPTRTGVAASASRAPVSRSRHSSVWTSPVEIRSSTAQKPRGARTRHRRPHTHCRSHTRHRSAGALPLAHPTPTAAHALPLAHPTPTAAHALPLAHPTPQRRRTAARTPDTAAPAHCRSHTRHRGAGAPALPLAPALMGRPW